MIIFCCFYEKSKK